MLWRVRLPPLGLTRGVGRRVPRSSESKEVRRNPGWSGRVRVSCSVPISGLLALFPWLKPLRGGKGECFWPETGTGFMFSGFSQSSMIG